MKKITLLIVLSLFGNLAIAQDTCSGPTVIPGAGLYVVTGLNGTAPTLVCTDNGPIPGPTPMGEWFSYTPTQDYTVTISTDIVQNTPRVDTRFHVYTGTCAALTCFAGDDDSGAGYSSVDVFNVTANTTYIIAFDNRWTANGFTFQVIEGAVVTPITTPVTFTQTSISTINSQYNLCAVDMNNDQRDDLVGVNQNNIRIHYQNTDGTFTFTDYSTSNADMMPSWSLAAGDYNKDGFNDLLYGGGSGLTFMRSNGGTGFVEDTPGQYIFCQRTNFIDLNNDGNLDAFSCHDVDPNVYYLNNGDGTFTYYQSGITAGAYSLGISSNGGNYGSVWIDYDNDGDLDLFIAKCGSVPPDELHRNNGDGTFTDISVEANLYDAGQSWSSAWADYDNDGDMDVLVGASSGAHKFKLNNLDTSNSVEEPFQDITAGSGWDANGSNSIEHIAYDFDNDGWVDVMGGGNKIMYNQGNNTFAPSTYPGMGVGAVGDFNNDGFLDIQNGNTLHISNGNDNGWIRVNLQGVQSNSNGIGARVEIYGSWGKQIRDIRSGEGFKYMSTLSAHFGIGEATAIDQVIIRWPSGTVDVIVEPAPNQSITVVEGSSPELGVGENITSKFTVSPNPVADVMNLTFSSFVDVDSAVILDLNGRKVMSVSVENNKIDVKSLSGGMYILALKNVEGQQFTQKFIKK